MADVFISYSSSRRPAIQDLADIIVTYGYSVWFDCSLLSGGDFSRMIEKELRAAKAVLVAWCDLSIESDWVRNEATLAIELGTLIPVKLAKIAIPWQFRNLDYINLTNWDFDPRSPDLDRLLRQIEIKVGREPIVDHKLLVRQSEKWRVHRLAFTQIPLLEKDKAGQEEKIYHNSIQSVSRSAVTGTAAERDQVFEEQLKKIAFAEKLAQELKERLEKIESEGIGEKPRPLDVHKEVSEPGNSPSFPSWVKLERGRNPAGSPLTFQWVDSEKSWILHVLAVIFAVVLAVKFAKQPDNSQVVTGVSETTSLFALSLNDIYLTCAAILFLLSCSLLTRRRSYLVLQFVMATLALSAWNLCSYIIGKGLLPSQVSLISRLQLLTALLFCTGLLNFCWSFPFGRPHRLQMVTTTISAMFSAGFLYTLDLSDAMLEKGQIRYKDGVGFFLYTVYVCFVFISILAFLFKAWRRYPEQRNQIRFFFAGVITFTVGSSVFNLALPILGNYDYLFIGRMSSTVTSLLFFYPIAKHEFLDVTVIINKKAPSEFILLLLIVLALLVPVGSATWF